MSIARRRARLFAGAALIAALYAAARWLASVVALPVPAPIVALLALLLLLRLPAVERLVAPAATLLIGLLGALLVPPLVEAFFLDLHWSVGRYIAVALLLVLTTLATGLATALLARRLLRP